MAVPVAVTIDPCVEVRQAEVGRVVEIELRIKLSPPSAEATRAEVTCEGDAVEIRVDDPITRKRLTRRVPVVSLGASTKSRLLALAVVELVSASWTELESDVPPAVEPEGPKPNPIVRDDARKVVKARSAPAAPRWRTSLIGGPGYDVSSLGLSWGGGARVRYRLTSSIGLTSDVFAEGGARDDPRGRISWQKASAAAFVTWFHDVGTRHRVEIGAGARGGYLKLAGSPGDSSIEGSAFSAMWGGPELLATFSSRVAGALFVEVTGAAGYATLPVRGLADGARVAGIDGVWLRPTIGVGAEF
jgi:hypothetical protein